MSLWIARIWGNSEAPNGSNGHKTFCLNELRAQTLYIHWLTLCISLAQNYFLKCFLDHSLRVASLDCLEQCLNVKTVFCVMKYYLINFFWHVPEKEICEIHRKPGQKPITTFSLCQRTILPNGHWLWQGLLNGHIERMCDFWLYKSWRGNPYDMVQMKGNTREKGTKNCASRIGLLPKKHNILNYLNKK